MRSYAVANLNTYAAALACYYWHCERALLVVPKNAEK